MFRYHYHLIKTALNYKTHRAQSTPDGYPMLSSHECPSAQASAARNDAVTRGPLSKFELRGFRPSAILSDDENYMDIVMIITRSSMLRQGSMGCVLVRPKVTADGKRQVANEDSRQHDDRGIDRDILGRIIAAAINTSLFQPNDSDVHAEINAIGQVAKRNHLVQTHDSAHDHFAEVSTRGATAYITMPPCKRCFGALYASGIKRIVSRVEHPSLLLRAAREVGIDMSFLTQQQLADQKVRLDRLFARGSVDSDVFNQSKCTNENANHTDTDEILNRRKQRKKVKHARKMAKIEQEERLPFPPTRQLDLADHFWRRLYVPPGGTNLRV
jgi:tRNA(Arg) A34 adenosine deaminase TadA